MTDEPKIDELKIWATTVALETEPMNLAQRTKYIYEEAKKFFRVLETRNLQLRFIDSEMPLRQMGRGHGEMERREPDPRRNLETTKPFEAEEEIADS